MSVDTEEEKAHWVRCFGAYSVLSEAEIAKVSHAVELEVQVPMLSPLPAAREVAEELTATEDQHGSQRESWGEEDEVPRGQWRKSEVTSKLNTGSRRKRPTTRERKQRRPGSNKATGKENEEEGEPRRGMVTRSGPGSRPRSPSRSRKK